MTESRDGYGLAAIRRLVNDRSRLAPIARLLGARVLSVEVQLIFQRRVNRRTPGRFRTRVLTEGVAPSLHVEYKGARLKRYHEEGRAVRT